MAQAIGLKLYDQKRRKLLAEQLAAVKLICQNGKNFPVTVKGKGWLRAEVVAWAKVNLKLSKDKRTFALQEIAARKDAKAQSQDLPPQAAPAGDDLFLNLTAEEIAEKNKRRLDYLQDIHLNPGARFSPTGGILKLTTTEVKELRAARPWLFVLADDEKSKSGNDSEIIYGGLEGVAAAINTAFSGANCHRAYVSDWIKGKRAPCGRPGVPPMPGSPEGNGRFPRQPIMDWYRKYVLVETSPQELGMKGGLDARSRKDLADAEMAELELDGLKKSVSEKHMETVTVLGFIGGFAHWLGLQQDKFIEDRPGVRKIVAECVTKIFQPTVEQLAALDVQLTAQLAAANSAMKTATAHRVTELVNDLTEQRKQEIQAAKQG